MAGIDIVSSRSMKDMRNYCILAGGMSNQRHCQQCQGTDQERPPGREKNEEG
jgi:hypothetical protein